MINFADLVTSSYVMWGINGAIAIGLCVYNWGNKNKKKAESEEKANYNLKVMGIEKTVQELNEMVVRHKGELDALRSKTDKIEGYMNKASEDFARAMEQMEKMADRMTTVADRMLTKDDLALILQIQGK